VSAKVKKVIKSKKTKETKAQLLEKNIEQLTMKLSELEDKHVRLKAEFDNFRKRKVKEISNLIRYEGEDVFKSILSITDDLDRMKNAIAKNNDKDSTESILQGIGLIMQKINKLFEEREIIPFGKVGDILDSNLHDALMVREEKGKKDNEILEVFEKGFKYKDRIIRHAKVVVNKA